MTESKELEHFRNLVTLAAVDGKIEEIERITLSKIAFEKGIPMETMNEMLSKAREFTYFIPQNNDDREQQLEDMTKFAVVDGHFATAEYYLILRVGKKLGFTAEEADAIIQKYK